MERKRLPIAALCLCTLMSPALAGDDALFPSADPPAWERPMDLSLKLDIAAPAWDVNGTEQAPVPDGADPFDAGSWTLQTYGSATVFNDNDGVLYLSHTGVGYFLIDNLSLNLEVVAGGIDSKDSREDDGYALGLDLLLRWHFIRHGNDWSIFTDIGGGLIWTQNPFPAGGTHQNFVPQAGFGATFRLADNVHLIGGARWHHISNARKRGLSRNPGFDGAMFYVGMMIPF